MEQNKFYEHVSSWIGSYHNPEALEWLRRFVNNSFQAQEVKEQLHREIDWKICSLRNRPCFSEVGEDLFLVDEQGHPKVYTTRFSAICKLAELKLKGYDAELKPGSVFYRITLTQPVVEDEVMISVAS
jgi:hypothetical protein